jgi:hypothetical protein
MVSASKLILTGLVVACAATFAPGATKPALAQSCGDLWYERNKIYARNGYCFKTERAISTFGAGCFPPYGRLSGWEKERVDEIQMMEARRGC